jgi:hypothetical protein
VQCKHTTLHKASGKHFALSTTFDFTGVSEQDILKAATEMLLIRWRTAFKNAEKVDDSADNQHVMVSDMLRNNRPRFSKEERVNKAVQALSSDDKKALLAKLMAELNVDEEEEA